MLVQPDPLAAEANGALPPGESRRRPERAGIDSLDATIRSERQVLAVRWIGIVVGAGAGPLLFHGPRLMGLWLICAAASVYCLLVERLLLRRRSPWVRRGHWMTLGDILLAGAVIVLTGGVASQFYLVYFSLGILTAVRFGGRATLVSLGIVLASYVAAIALVGVPHDQAFLGRVVLRLGFIVMTTAFAAFWVERARAAEARVARAYDATISALSAALDQRDVETQGHSLRVAAYAVRLGAEAGLGPEQLNRLGRGAMLHDIGKIGIPDEILRKPAPLETWEWDVMRRHPTLGASILADIPFLKDALPVVLHHHERWDGAGYPDRQRGSEIDVTARVFAIVDTYDAITSNRPYRRGGSHNDAVAEIVRHSGTQFDPHLVALFARVPSQEWRAAIRTTRVSFSEGWVL